jgi:hypothetical protein
MCTILSDLVGTVKSMFEINTDESAESLEAAICELAGHLTAATCRFLILLGEFDAREGWASWDMPSCAAWLGWKCQMGSSTAREHVRVARALRSLPVIRAGFAAGRLSYSKVRALTRIADPGSDSDLAEMAAPMTANQLDRFARAHRTVTEADAAQTRLRRRLTWRYEEDGSLVLTARLPPEDGVAVLTALRAVLHDTVDGDGHERRDHADDALAEAHQASGTGTARRGHAPAEAASPDGKETARPEGAPAEARQPGDTGTALPGGAPAAARAGEARVEGASAEARAARAPEPDREREQEREPDRERERERPTSASLADALTEIAEAYLTHRASHASNPDAYQVIVHADPAALAGREDGRCHIEDGPAISTAALQQIMCGAVRRWMSHDRQGNVLNVGRRRRDPTNAIRCALRERDGCRCRFPGCNRRATQAHHVRWWLFGGITSLDNLISLCRYHHTLIHQHGYNMAVRGPGVFVFLRPDGKPIPHSPPLPQPTGDIADTHDAEITPGTIVPYWFGERLDLHYAISVLFNNQRARQEREQMQRAAAAA